MNNLPFKTLKFCSTSVPSDIRIEMVSKIKAMGGEHFSHLMSDVDVLVVGDRDTDKFRYTVKNRADVRLIRPKAIYELYDLWLTGKRLQDTILDDYLLPVFDNFNICISRIADSAAKKQTIKNIKANSGMVTDSLTINNSCVISTETSGKRFDKAQEWGIPVVHPRWVFDSVKRGAALEFAAYDIAKVASDNYGESACNCWEKLAVVEAERQQAKRSAAKADIDSEHGQVTAKIRRREDGLWKNIMQSVRATSQEPQQDTAWEETSHGNTNDDDDYTNNETTDASAHFKLRARPKSIEPTENTDTGALFSNLNFGVYGFNESKQIEKLGKVIKSHGGAMIDCSVQCSPMISYLLIPSTMAASELPQRLSAMLMDNGVKVITEWFVERCLHYNRIMLDKWTAPLAHPNLKLNLKISLSGFTGVELLHLIKLVTMLGCEYCETLTAKRDILVLNVATLGLNKETSPKLFSYKYPEVVSSSEYNKAGITSTRNKIGACKKWGIPIVTTAYLMEAGELGALPELLDYKWCVFAPGDLAKPRDLMEYVKVMSNDNFETPHEEPSNDKAAESPSAKAPKLPSPLKKKKKNWGRLIGRAQESQMTKEFTTDDFTSGRVNDEVSDSDLGFPAHASTQISYNDSSNVNKDDLDSRRDTRSHFKELSNRLD